MTWMRKAALTAALLMAGPAFQPGIGASEPRFRASEESLRLSEAAVRSLAFRDLEKKLDDRSRDLVVTMRRLEQRRRQGVQRRIEAMLAQYPVAAPRTSKRTGILERTGVKRFFQGLFGSKKATLPTRAESFAPAEKWPIAGAWGGLAKTRGQGPRLTDLWEGRKSRLVGDLKGLIEEAIGRIPTDAQIRSGAAALGPEDMSLLGAAFNALTAVRLAESGVALGFKGYKADPQCPNVLLAEERTDGEWAGQFETSYLSRYFKEVSRRNTGPTAAEEKARIARAVWIQGKFQEALNCQSLRDISALDTHTARGMLHLHFWLWASGKGLAARTLMENHLQAGLYLQTAAQSFKIPESYRFLFLDADYRSLATARPVSVRLADGEEALDIEVGDRVVLTLPPLNRENAALRLARFTAADRAEANPPLVKFLLGDEEKTTYAWLGGIRAPYPWANGAPVALVGRHRHGLSEIHYSVLDFPKMGEGTCSPHERAANGLTCQDMTTCRILDDLAGGAGVGAAEGGDIRSFFAGLSRQPGGDQSASTHFGVGRSEIGGHCVGSGGPVAGSAPVHGSPTGCVVSSGFSGMMMGREDLRNLQCAATAGLEGQMKSFRAMTDLGGGGFGCRFSLVSREGDLDSRTVWTREARGAVADIHEMFGVGGHLPQDADGSTIAGGIAELVGGLTEEEAGKIFELALASVAEDYAEGDFYFPNTEDTRMSAFFREAVHRAVNNFGPAWVAQRESSSGAAEGGSGSGDTGGGTGSGGIVDPWTGKESSDIVDPWKGSKSGAQQCGPDQGVGCTEGCSGADEMIKGWTDCVEPSAPAVEGSCPRLTPDGCGPRGLGEAPAGVVDPLAGCVATPPPVSSYAGCINVYCDAGDPACCGGAEGGGGGPRGSSTPGGHEGEGGSAPVIPIGPSIMGPSGNPEIDIPIDIPSPVERR